MFGQNNDTQAQQPYQNGPAVQPSENNPPAGFFNPAAQAAPPAPTDNTGVVPNAPGAPDAPDTPDALNAPDAPMIMDVNPTSFVAPSTPADGPTDNTPINGDVSTGVNGDLLSMKQEALQELKPLVSHLDQSPEEKFRTVMMMIQASDDHTKLNEAFDLAKQISDDKTRAQALLDVINEINYFTQQQSS